MLRRAILVDPNARRLERARRAIGDATLTTFTDFQSAREQLLRAQPQFLATALRLGAYNGLHLVHLVASLHIDARCLVYSEWPDLVLVREALRAGAFYEDASRVPYALSSYLKAALPDHDRRSPEWFDRRATRRGGRRAADAVLFAQGTDEPVSLS
jgi:ActR/RegA family two-component response regulator